jgi:hypothetical protein
MNLILVSVIQFVSSTVVVAEVQLVLAAVVVTSRVVVAPTQDV